MTDHTATADAHAHEHPTVRAYLMVYAALMVLLVATVGLAFLDLHVNFLVSMIIAVIKATMVILIFMHVRYNEKLVWIFAGASLLWLIILLGLTLNDYQTRGWLNILGK